MDTQYATSDRSPASIVLGVFSPSVLLRVTRRSGRLEEQGLDVTEVAVSSSPAQFAALRDGQLDMVLTSPDNVLAYRYSADNALGQMLDARIVGAVDRGLGLALYGRPGKASPDLLRGGTFGVDVPTSGFAFAMFALAESVGLGRSDYRVATLGSTPKRLEALLAGACDATLLNAGSELRAEDAGCVAIARGADLLRPYLGTVLAVVGPDRLPLAGRLAVALRGTAQEICDGSHDRLAAEEAESALGVSAALAARYVERLKSRRDGLVANGRVDHASMQTLVGLRRRYSSAESSDRLSAALDPNADLYAEHAWGDDR